MQSLLFYHFSGVFFLNTMITTVKHVKNGHSKIDKTKVLKTNGSLMKIEIIADCSR